VLEKITKGLGVLFLAGHVNYFSGAPIVGANQMMPFLLSRRGDTLLLASFHPAFDQDAQKPQGRFVHKE
jgi:hypothetical protein